MTVKKKRLVKRLLLVVLIVIVVITAAFGWYVNDYSRADDTALVAVADENGPADGVTVSALADGEIVFVPEQPRAGLIFYPGGKVEPEAYAPLLTQCASRGILCVLVQPPFNLAFFDINAADGIPEQFPEVDTWMIGGHSLGGVAATSYLAHHESDYDDLVLLASYSASDLTEFGGEVLLVVGSEDGVLNRDAYEDALDLLPAGAQEIVIDGGNHAGFGNYGEQDGDGKASVSRVDQQAQTADAIARIAET